MNDRPMNAVDVSHCFGAVEALRGITLPVASGEFVAIVGPSGCGKSTLLSLLSGFTQPTSGKVVRQGCVRTVFQRDGLFPWLTCEENIALGVRASDDKRQRDETRRLMELIRLNGFSEKYPHQLSGGMRQLVELARALAGNTDILLLDEPFSALDYLSRLRMRSELVRLLKECPRTVVLVTHDIEEAAQLADRIVILTERPGRIRGEIRLDTARPRNPTDPEVVAAVHRILVEMRLESVAPPPEFVL